MRSPLRWKIEEAVLILWDWFQPTRARPWRVRYDALPKKLYCTACFAVRSYPSVCLTLSMSSLDHNAPGGHVGGDDGA